MNARLAPLLVALAATGTLALTACGAPSSTPTGTAPTNPTEATASGTVTVSSHHGEVTVPARPQRVAALDNTSFETLKAMGVQPVAVPKELLPSTLSEWAEDPAIVDAGTHREPKLEELNAADPDLIIGGKRFVAVTDQLSAIAPTIDIAPDVEQPDYIAQLKQQTTTLGDLFGKADVAARLNADLDTAVADAAALTNGQTVFLANHNGGKIDNAAGRIAALLQPLNMVDVFARTSTGGSDSIHSDSGLSPETVAQANPDWLIVMDRDAATTAKGQASNPAKATIEAQEAWRNTTFVQKGHILYLPPDFYITEGIQAYTGFYAQLAEGLKGAA